MTAKLNIALTIQTPLWKSRLKPYKKTVQEILDVALSETNLKNKSEIFEVAVVLADDEFVRGLNKEFRGKDKPTNVLSFPNESPELGDIILAIETIEREAKEQGKTFHEHTAHLLVHGFLHLLGYDHEQEKDAEKMERKEIKILKSLGIKNPYLEK
jgi:probable rRNA maturation factor